MSKKSNIADLLLNELKQIDKTIYRGEHTFRSNVYGNAFRGFKFLDQINDFPCIYFIMAQERLKHIGADVRYGFIDVQIRGYVRVEDNVEAAEDLAEDIDFVLTNFRETQGAHAFDVEESKVTSLSTDEGLLYPYGVCDVTAVIMYQH